jgi:hypothetical protein
MHTFPLAWLPCPLQVFLFWKLTPEGRMGRAAQGHKRGDGGGGGHGLSRAEAEIRLVRVERGECGGGGAGKPVYFLDKRE